MEYTKDIVLELGVKRQAGGEKWKNWTSSIKKEIRENKMLIMTITLLTALMLTDILLVNSFLQLFSKVY